MGAPVGQITFSIGIDGEVSPCDCDAVQRLSKPQRLPDPNRRIGVVGGIDQLRFAQAGVGPVAGGGFFGFDEPFISLGS